MQSRHLCFFVNKNETESDQKNRIRSEIYRDLAIIISPDHIFGPA